MRLPGEGGGFVYLSAWFKKNQNLQTKKPTKETHNTHIKKMLKIIFEHFPHNRRRSLLEFSHHSSRTAHAEQHRQPG